MTIGDVKEEACVGEATENCYQTALSFSSNGHLSVFWLHVLHYGTQHLVGWHMTDIPFSSTAAAITSAVHIQPLRCNTDKGIYRKTYNEVTMVGIVLTTSKTHFLEG